MSELGDYRRIVERPMIDGYEATIKSQREEIERLRSGLKSIVDRKNPMTRAAVREACAEILTPRSTQ